jgi:hypothetical protein
MLQCSTDLLLQTSSEKEEEIADLTPRRRRRRRMNGANDNFTFFSLAVCTSFLQGFFLFISVLISLSNEDLSVQPATYCFAKF